MAGLLYKELILNKKTLIMLYSSMLFISIFLFIPIPSDLKGEYYGIYELLLSMLCVILFMICGVIQQGIFAYDERKKWADFISSTPLSVNGQVLSKYYFSLLISIATLVYCNIVFSINAVIQGKDSGVMNIAIILFTIQIFLRSIEFPFFVRFSSKYGNNYKSAVFGVIFMIIFVYLLFGDLSMFGTFDEFMEWYMKLYNSNVISDILLLILALAPFAVGFMYFLSYKISCRFYLKGAESYDK